MHIKPLVTAFFSLYASTLQADINNHFNSIKTDPNALYAFFKAMPKGGELHYHLAGGPYPETMLKLAAQAPYCIDKKSFAVSKGTFSCDGVKSSAVINQQAFYDQVVRSWSMKNFIPGEESGHDHFFNGFMKYMPIVTDFKPQLIADVMQRAASQHENYLELLDIPDNASSTRFGNLLTNIQSYDKKRQLLLSNQAFQDNIEHTVNETNAILNKANLALGCPKHPEAPACKIKVTILYYVLREQPLDNVFAQALNAFEAVSRSKGALVGVNLVQPEDGLISLRDYHKQMNVFAYFHRLYPEVKISLHAGEITSEQVSPEHLEDHIHEAIFTARASRIGHGTDIAHENDALKTLDYMATKHIPVEINLVSNEKILNVSGHNSPLNFYLTHNVPVVLSTDDEGILRTDLTSQYVAAVTGSSLDYPTLKQINRNTLTYGFIPGSSIWADANKAVLVEACRELTSTSCKEFAAGSEKAQLQWNLEQQLAEFESKY